MEIAARIRKHSRGGPPDWIVHVPLLDLYTQGYSRKEALRMLQSAVEEYIEYYFGKSIAKRASITVTDSGKSTIGVTCSNLSVLMSLILIKQREKTGTPIREVVARIGGTSPNAYKQYEYGKKRMSTEKFDQLVRAVNPQLRLLVSVA